MQYVNLTTYPDGRDLRMHPDDIRFFVECHAEDGDPYSKLHYGSNASTDNWKVFEDPDEIEQLVNEAKSDSMNTHGVSYEAMQCLRKMYQSGKHDMPEHVQSEIEWWFKTWKSS